MPGRAGCRALGPRPGANAARQRRALIGGLNDLAATIGATLLLA
jgi:hypothetical protein